MSRIGKKPIEVPAGVKISIKDGVVQVEGPKGKLTQRVPSGIQVV
ncbi:MAG: 50S ribosomal protein L6, partial [Alphaproteobacteria bacterium]